MELNTHLTPRELAERWSMSVDTLNNWRCAGKGPKYLKKGYMILYPLTQVRRFEKTRKTKR